MTIETIITCLVWGICSGFLLLRLVECLLAAVICLQGLFLSRWKRLVNRNSPGQIRYGTIIDTLLRVLLFGLLFGIMFEIGDTLARREFRFNGQGSEGILWAGTAGLTALLMLRNAWQRLDVVWKLTHIFDYAEKRNRTILLKK